MICWLIAWAQEECQDEDEHLHLAGKDFLQSLLQKFGWDDSKCASIKSHDISLQDNRADILVKITTENEEAYCLIIEDKVDTSEHGDQLKRYVTNQKEGGNKWKEKFNEEHILRLYFKTGLQSDFSTVKCAGYKIYQLCDYMKVLKKHRGNCQKNLIFRDYISYLRKKQDSYKEWQRKPINKDWWFPWEGFFDRLKNDFQEELEGQERNWKWSVANNPQGAYPILYYSGDDIHADSNEKPHVLYIQLDKGIGTIRMSPCDANIRQKVSEKLEQDAVGEKLSTANSQKKRFDFGSGKTCKIFEFNYLIDSSGNQADLEKGNDQYVYYGKFKIDLDKTKSRIRNALEMLKRVAEEMKNKPVSSQD